MFLSLVLLSGCNNKPSLTKLPPLPNPSSTDTVKPTPGANFFTSDDPVWGQANAPITMVVFSDFQCPYCGKFAEELSQLEKDWISTGKVKVQYRDFPLAMHKNSLSAHAAASAAERQGKYWEYHQFLYRDRAAWEKLENPSDYLLGIAKDLGLDIDKFVNDYNDPSIIAEITTDRNEGRLSGLEGTPAYLINNKLYNGLMDLPDLIKVLQAIKS